MKRVIDAAMILSSSVDPLKHNLEPHNFFEMGFVAGFEYALHVLQDQYNQGNNKDAYDTAIRLLRILK